MNASVFVVVMSSVLFNPSFAFSSHFDPGGSPLSELSWPSSLAVVAVSFSGLFTFVFLMLACLCCKKGDISFKEFENTEGEEGQANLSTLASPSSQNDPEVYILPLTEVSLPVSKQPNKSFQNLKSTDLGRHSLLYIKEMGHGWFGKVLLGEVNAGLSSTQVVVKELKASASVQEQMQFLEEVQPYRVLQHPALLQCLSQCSEVTPYLLVMEHCPLGDVKGYLRSCRATDSVTPDPLILQRMACEISSGLLYLHKHNYIHSDLALRNCLLTSELAVKIGDYGLSHSKYKDDYYVTADQIWVPLRWIAPELIDEVHGNLLVVDQTKASNVWSLGVTIWELFELGNQPYRHYSDRQVLTYAVKEQQLKLPKPLLKVPLCERWYEVMQFCWLQPEQRPVVEEVHLLLSYLCAKGATEAEEDFEQRWNSLRPSLGSNSSHRTPAPEVASSTSSSFPLLEHFSMAESFQSENGDDILTVTETSHGLNFEYKWEQAQAEQPYCSSTASGPLGKNNPHYQDVYYPLSNSTGSCKGESLPLGVSPSYYDSDHPGVVPVLSAHSPSVSSEYYIRIEEPVECNINIEETNLDYSPRVEASNSSLSSTDRRSPIGSQPDSYWSAAKESISNDYDSDSSLNVEPLQRRVPSSVETDQSESYFSSHDRQNLQCEESPQAGPDVHLIRGYGSDSNQQRRGSGSLCQRLEAVQESPLGISVSLSSPSLAYCDPYLESNQRTAERSMANEAYYDMMGPMQKNVPRPHYMSIDIDAGDGLLLGMGSANPEDDDDLFSPNMLTNWNSNHSANNNSLSDRTQAVGFRDAYLDLRHPTPSSHVENLKTRALETSNSCAYNCIDSLKVHSYMEATDSTPTTSNLHTDSEGGEYLHLCPEGTRDVESSSKCHSVTESQHINTRQKNIAHKHIKNNTSDFHVGGYSRMNPSTLPTDIVVTTENMLLETRISSAQNTNIGTGSSAGVCVKMVSCPKDLPKSVSECNHLTDSGMVPNNSSISLVEINDYSDDCTDIPSGVLTDYPLDYAEVGNIELTHRPLQRETGSRQCEDTINLASSSSPCEAFSPDSYHTSIQPKSLDSGYDTENNESPEFILKDLEGNPTLSTSVESDECDMMLQMDLDEDVNVILLPSSSHFPLISLGERNQYRDSAYFSDYDVENDKSPSEGGSNFFNRQDEDYVFEFKAAKEGSEKTVRKEGHDMKSERGNNISVPKDNNSALRAKQLCLKKTNPNLCSSPTLVPMISTLSPFPPEMGGCLTKESTPDDGIGLESDHSGEEPNSDCYSSTVSEGSSSTQEASGVEEPSNGDFRDFSSAESLGSDCIIVDFSREMIQTEEQEACNKVDNPELPREGHNEEKEDEDSVEEGDIGQAFSRSKHDDSLENILPALPEDLDVPAPLGNGEDADEEESEDSDESDEELRSYNIQEQSDESDDEFPVVPVIVSDRSSARHLRSLLKMPSILTQSFCDELESKKKAVSFFDDVTVFLFDQESPTGELGDYSFPVEAEPNGQASEVELPQPQDTVIAPEDSPGRDFPEESGAFEWQDDFPLMPSPSTSESNSEEITTPPNSPVKSPDDKPAPPLSRFSVSRFSITHVSDSDVDSMGGNSENGAQE